MRDMNTMPMMNQVSALITLELHELKSYQSPKMGACAPRGLAVVAHRDALTKEVGHLDEPSTASLVSDMHTSLP
jgi:hypothetical protein